MARLTDEKRQEILSLYMKDTTVTAIESLTGVTRATIHSLMRKGWGTNGVSWQEYRERHRDVSLQVNRAAELEKANGEKKQFLEAAKDDLREIAYEKVIEKIRTGQFDAKVGDLTEIVRLYNMLENGAAEKMAFAKFFVGKVMEIVIDILTERQYAEFRVKVELLQQEVEAKLNPLMLRQMN
jgi:IS30 family transposase